MKDKMITEYIIYTLIFQKPYLEKFLILNSFEQKDENDYYKGRLNVSLYEDSFSILGASYQYDALTYSNKIVEIFSSYEPNWCWLYFDAYRIYR